jgi:hypothetical protein
MFATPSEAVVERTLELWDDKSVRHAPVWVTGLYDREPHHDDTLSGHLPNLVIPVVSSYADGRRVLQPHILTAGKVLAAWFYGLTRDGIHHDQIIARVAPMAAMLGCCFLARCAHTRVPIIVKEPSRDIEAARTHVQELYHPDSDVSYFAGINTSRDVRPLDITIF